MFPLGLSYILTAMKNGGYEFDFIDIDATRPNTAELTAQIAKKAYDVICIGTLVTGYKVIKELCALLREVHKNSIIIVGNTVASSIYNTLLNKTEADIAVLVEGDETIVDLLRTLSQGKPLDAVNGIAFRKGETIHVTPERKLIKDLDTLPFVDFDIFDIEKYIANGPTQVNDPFPIPKETVRVLPINTARGCIANCGFCYHTFKGKPYRTRSTASILSEIERVIEKYGANYISFYDELTFYNKKQTLAFASEIIKRGLKFYWMANCRADLFSSEEDKKIIEIMIEAGCHGVGYSLESSNREILKAMNKHITAEQFTYQTGLFRSVGLPVWTSLVFGYPQETKDTIQDTFDVCIANGIYPSIGYLLPQPGSAIYDYALSAGAIPKNEEEYLLILGDRQDLRINLTSMSDEEFTANVLAGATRCNRELGIGLSEESLIKTLHYCSTNTSETPA
ncbi:B12-binding domain-containing radical SAM protein [Fundidesulfovibrio butyratiphilus]